MAAVFITFICFHCMLFGLDVLAGKKSVCFCIEMHFFSVFVFLTVIGSLLRKIKDLRRSEQRQTRVMVNIFMKKKIDACIIAAQVYTLVNCKRGKKKPGTADLLNEEMTKAILSYVNSTT